MADDTRRLLDSELPDELRDTLESAAADGADAQSLARLRAGLESSIGPAWNMRAPSMPAPHEIAGVAGHGSAGAALGAKLFATTAIALGVSAMLALGIAGYMARTRTADRAPASATVSPQPSAAPALSPVAAPAPAPAAPNDTQVRAAPAAARTRATATRNEPSLSEELKGLERIRQAMVDPNRALLAAERQARRFPNGALVPERELLQLEALYKAGQTARAEQLAARLTSEAAQHPYRAQALQLQQTQP